MEPPSEEPSVQPPANSKAVEYVVKSGDFLSSIATKHKVKYQDIEVGFDFDPEPGLADNGDLEHDLQALLEVAGAAALEELPLDGHGRTVRELMIRLGLADTRTAERRIQRQLDRLCDADVPRAGVGGDEQR